MTYTDANDLWWSDALMLVAEPGGGAVGPARMRQAGWQHACEELVGGEYPRVAALAARQGFVLSRGQARLCGLPDRDLRRLLRNRTWTAPRRGILCPLPLRVDERPHGGSPEIAVAAVVCARAALTASHESAAILYGLPILTAPVRIQLTTPNASAGGGWADCLVHAAPTPRAELTDWFGTPVTTVARTVIDIARSGGVAAGLATADATLHEGLLSREQLAASLRRARRRPGVRSAARVVELADSRAESVLESLTRLCLIGAGLPVPEPQGTVGTHRGGYRVDLLFRAHRVVVEADGRLKYRRDEGALWREKLRQEAIERAGYVVVRVTWDDVVRHPEETIARVRRALATAATLATG